MNNRPDLNEWEQTINALLDGELDEHEAEALKTAAGKNQALAQAIVEAYQLQQALARIPQERAPASLRRKLADIPRQHARLERKERYLSWLQPRWVTALAAIPLVIVIGLNLGGPKEPSQAEIAQAQQELAIAFAYLGKVNRKTKAEIGNTVNSEMQETVNENMIQAIQDQMEFNKERKA